MMSRRSGAAAIAAAALFAGLTITVGARQQAGPPSGTTGPQGSAAMKADPKDWIQLFNGKDLKDWTPKFAHSDLGVNVNDTFRVEDGLMKVRYDKWNGFKDEFGHIFYREPFSYYLLAA